LCACDVVNFLGHNPTVRSSFDKGLFSAWKFQLTP
jgi:hypothetical protein